MLFPARSFLLACHLSLAGTAMCHAGEDATSAGAAGRLSAKEAGARYGQALGAVEVCYGSKMTEAGAALAGAYSGKERDAFMAAAGAVFKAWREARACAHPLDPNPCRIIIDRSCAGAEAEIGIKGSAVPGLVDFPAR